MVVERDHDVVFLHELLQPVNQLRRFRRDGPQAHGLGELEQLAPLRLFGGERNHRIAGGLEFALGQLGLDLLYRLRRGVIVERHVGVFFAQARLGGKLDDCATALGGLRGLQTK